MSKRIEVDWKRDFYDDCKLVIDRSQRDPDGTLVNKVEFQFKDKRDENKFNHWYCENPEFHRMINEISELPISIMRKNNLTYKEYIFCGVNIGQIENYA